MAKTKRVIVPKASKVTKRDELPFSTIKFHPTMLIQYFLLKFMAYRFHLRKDDECKMIRTCAEQMLTVPVFVHFLDCGQVFSAAFQEIVHLLRSTVPNWRIDFEPLLKWRKAQYAKWAHYKPIDNLFDFYTQHTMAIAASFRNCPLRRLFLLEVIAKRPPWKEIYAKCTERAAALSLTNTPQSSALVLKRMDDKEMSRYIADNTHLIAMRAKASALFASRCADYAKAITLFF
jgi:hypothetical protein